MAPPRFELGTPASSGQRSTTELKSQKIWTYPILLEVERSDKATYGLGRYQCRALRR